MRPLVATAGAGHLPGHFLAIGGGAGFVHFLVRLFIWRAIWRLVLSVWHVPAFGPWLVVLIGCALVGLVVWRQQRGPFLRAGARWLPGRRRRGGLTGYGTGSGPRDW
ncbi:MAG: hypothetical protein J2P29_16205 [Actinobacteria bacterium]|nr:hypothetical protein [Actinomycetota bacterium]